MWIAIEEPVRSFEIIEIICIIYISQIRETVGAEAFFAPLENRNLNFLAIKNWEFTALSCEFQILAGAQGLEPWAYGFGVSHAILTIFLQLFTAFISCCFGGQSHSYLLQSAMSLHSFNGQITDKIHGLVVAVLDTHSVREMFAVQPDKDGAFCNQKSERSVSK